MKYIAPHNDNGKPYYVPVVTKNKDQLVGYIQGMSYVKLLVGDVLINTLGLTMNMGEIVPVLDSTRFNDILPNDMRESDMEDKELERYIDSLTDETLDKLSNDNSENNIDTDEENALTIECVCDFGIFAWKHFRDIPEVTFLCPECGRVLIHYTHTDFYEYEFDGEPDDSEESNV